MKWIEAGNLLHSEMSGLATRRGASMAGLHNEAFGRCAEFQDFERKLREMDRSSAGHIEVAARKFAEEKAWPELPAEALYMLILRMACAMDLLNVLCMPLRAPVVPDSQAPEHAILEYLLITTWNWRRDHWLMARAFQMATGGTLY